MTLPSANLVSAPLSGRWNALMAGMLAQAVVSSLQQGLPALGPLLIERYDLSLSALGALLSSSSWGLMLTLYLWGRIADRYGERWVVASGLTGMGLVLCLAPFTTTALQLGTVIFLAGAMSASTIAATGRAIMGWFPRSERGMALGLRQMAVPVGAAVSAMVLPFVAISHGAPSAFLALAAIAGLAALVSVAVLRPPPGMRPSESLQPPPLRDRAIWTVSAASGLMQWTQVAISAFFILILVERQGTEYPTAVLIFAAVLLASGVTRVAFGWYSDRLAGRVPLLTGYAAGLSLLLLLAAGAQLVQSTASTVVMILACLAVFSWNGLAFAAVAELAGPARAGAALGLHGTLMRAITLPAAIAFGWSATQIGWSGGLALLSVFPAIAAVMLVPVREVEARRNAASDNL